MEPGTQLNSLDEPTTIHLHGMFLAGINYFDGAARVTQWWVFRVAHTIATTNDSFLCVCSGIPPGETFIYDVPFEKAGQSGTYWAHGHFTVGNDLALVSEAP